MKQLCILFIFLFLYACNNSSTNKDYKIPDYEKIADTITARTAQKIESETGLHLIGTGGGMMDHVRMMAMSFDHLEETSIEQGRELLVYCVKEYLDAINANVEIRPYLAHYPFTSKDVEIAIFIYTPTHKDVSIGKLAVVSAVRGELRYRVRQLDPVIFKQIYEETYEEAVKILETGEPVNKVRKSLSHV